MRYLLVAGYIQTVHLLEKVKKENGGQIRLKFGKEICMPLGDAYISIKVVLIGMQPLFLWDLVFAALKTN